MATNSAGRRRVSIFCVISSALLEPACSAFFFAVTLSQSRLRSWSMFCSRSNNRAIAAPSHAFVSSRNFSRISLRSSGCSGVPLKLSTLRTSARPSFKFTVTVEAMVWPCFASSATVMLTRRAKARIPGSLKFFRLNEAGSRGLR